ncbi:MAG: hypothetical protein ACUVTP_04200 [Candidatus Fervidibacter sp.]|uniref:hypothetical protein n=1 Tax=Candidatus Fervidibacter sp. TaxID=3100871 RepID=UPI00404A3586
MDKLAPISFSGIAGAVRWGKRLFLACGQDGMKVFELDGDRVELVAHLTDFPAFDLVAKKDCIVVAAGEQGIKVIDLKKLKLVRTLKVDFPVYSVSWNDSQLVAHSVIINTNQTYAFPFP